MLLHWKNSHWPFQAHSKKLKLPYAPGESFATVLESRGITENALGTQKWNRIQAQIKDTSWPWPFLPVYPGATITLTPNGIREYSSYSNSYYSIFDENDIEMLLYNPEYLTPLNTGYRKVDARCAQAIAATTASFCANPAINKDLILSTFLYRSKSLFNQLLLLWCQTTKIFFD